MIDFVAEFWTRILNFMPPFRRIQGGRVRQTFVAECMRLAKRRTLVIWRASSRSCRKQQSTTGERMRHW